MTLHVDALAERAALPRAGWHVEPPAVQRGVNKAGWAATGWERRFGWPDRPSVEPPAPGPVWQSG